MSIEIKKWNDIKSKFKSGLLLGNGASVAINNDFNYSSLKNYAESKGYLNNEVKKLFQTFETTDFEFILRIVWHSYLVNKALDLKDKKTEEAYLSIRDALINSVRDIHCNYDEAKSKFDNMYNFTKNFTTICSLNYDLTLYWLTMYGNKISDGHIFKDCFTNDEFNENISKFREPMNSRNEKECTLFFYPHGNLVFARNIYGREIKIKTSGNLLDTILMNWENNSHIPLFVSEGIKSKKVESIQSSHYLNTVYNKVLPKIGESLVIYGWGIGEQDKHIIEKICSGNTMRFAVSVFIDGNEDEYCHKVNSIIKNTCKVVKPYEIEFFDSLSQGCFVN